MTLTAAPPGSRRSQLEWLLLLGALVAMAAGIGYFQSRQYNIIDNRERDHLVSQAAIIEKNLVPQLRLANRVIDNVLHDLPGWRAENDHFRHANRQLKVINDVLFGIRPIAVLDANGTVTASSVEKLIGMNFASRAYFRDAINNPDTGVLHVSAPYKTNIDTYVISLFRVMHGPHGEFAGIVIVSLVPDYFSILLDSVRYTPDMRTSLAHEDGKVFLTAPKMTRFEGADLDKPGTFFRRHLDSRQTLSIFRGPVYISGGEERLMALQRIQPPELHMDHALVMAVSRNLEVLYTPWRKNFYLLAVLFGLLSVLCIVGLWVIQRRREALFSERNQAKEKINNLAFFDQLTGLPNRTLLMDRLGQAMAISSRSGNYGALLFIDLDNFKALNDTLGHDRGDQLLKQVALRLIGCMREGDTVARLGGDEFVVVLAELAPVDGDAAIGIEKVSEKILLALNRSYRLGTVPHYSTASIGATLFLGDESSIDDLMKQADLAMYKAKEAGRNSWRFFDPEMESAAKKLVALEEDLRRALDRSELLLYYQPQVVGTRTVTGAEVLVRWQHPERGMVEPADFIPLAERSGLILPLGHWVMQSACAQLARWADDPILAELTVAVNVSAHQFQQSDFVDQVLAVLIGTGANPKRLKLELTESMLVHNVSEIIEKMAALKDVGVGFSLDDFGTGYSSLSYMKQLPLDQLKIDQGFIRDILVDPNDAAIARMVIALARSMGLAVIAEGVELEAQRQLLSAMGCQAYQGHLFSRPLPVVEFERRIAGLVRKADAVPAPQART